MLNGPQSLKGGTAPSLSNRGYQPFFVEAHLRRFLSFSLQAAIVAVLAEAVFVGVNCTQMASRRLISSEEDHYVESTCVIEHGWPFSVYAQMTWGRKLVAWTCNIMIGLLLFLLVALGWDYLWNRCSGSPNQ